MASLGPTSRSICSRISSGIESKQGPSDESDEVAEEEVNWRGEWEVEEERVETDSQTFRSSVAMVEGRRKLKIR